MKIAIVAHAHPSISKGGAEIAAYTLYLGLRSAGVPVVFVAAVPHEALPRVVLATPDEHVLAFDPQDYSAALQLGSPEMRHDLLALLAQLNVGLVNFHHYINFGLGTLRAVREAAGLPVVLTLHEYLAICAHHGQMVTRPGRALCSAASLEGCAACFPEAGRAGMATRRDLFLEVLSGLDGFVAPSEFLIARHVAWGLPRARFTLIENGLRDTAPPPPRAPARDRGEAPLTFAYFGQINPFKGVDLLLDAAAILAADPAMAARFRLEIHGNAIGLSPAFEQRLAALAGQDHIRIAGPYDNRMVLQLMAGADYVMVPSRWWENSPVVIQEAFAAGRPVICPGIGGMAEKVQDGRAGWHFRAGSAADLARVMRDCISGAAVLPSGGLSQPDDAVTMARNYLDVFVRVIKGVRSTPALLPQAGPSRASSRRRR